MTQTKAWLVGVVVGALDWPLHCGPAWRRLHGADHEPAPLSPAGVRLELLETVAELISPAGRRDELTAAERRAYNRGWSEGFDWAGGGK